MSELLAAVLPADMLGNVCTSPHPTHGTFVTITLTAKAGRDAAVEQNLRSSLCRFTYAFDIVWISAERSVADANA
jgi:hypothetical protein